MGSHIDLSLLRRPLTPFTGFQEAKNAFDKGTAEVRHLLLFECGLIYECNICRNMFRSLANFISHKRVFCCTSSKDFNGKTNGTDGLQTPKHQSREYRVPKHGSELHQKIIEGMSNASNFQAPTEHRENNGIDASAEIKPESANQYNNHNSINSMERRSDVNAKPTEQLPNESQDISTPTYVFQCPSCSLTFLKSSAVIRHLAIAHNFPIRRIRMMRDSILKSRTDPPPSPSPSYEKSDSSLAMKPKNRELRNLLQINESSSSGNEEKILSNGHEENASKCFFCQKTFERRAALVAHVQSCPIKNEAMDAQEQVAAAAAAAAAPNDDKNKIESNLIGDSEEAAIAADVECKLIEEKDDVCIQFEEGDEDVKRTFTDLEKQSFGTGLCTLSLEKLDISACESTSSEADNDGVGQAEKSEMNICENIEKESKMNGKESSFESTSTKVSSIKHESLASIKKRRMRSTNNQSCRCKICGKEFNALSNLRRHISMFHYRSKKFGCELCDYCAFRRYDIINHLNFVHKMTPESDATSQDLVRINDVPYTKDDMNEDIVLCSMEDRNGADILITSHETDEQHPGEQSEQHETLKFEKPPEKRQRRKNKILIAPNNSSVENVLDQTNPENEQKLSRQKLKRTHSQPSESTNITTATKSGTQKRPKRNCTKPVNKDFVYDLSGLSKKETPQTGIQTSNETVGETYQLRGSKRRNTFNTQIEIIPPVPAFDCIKVKLLKDIKGSARRACLVLVNQGLAASSTLPEIPAERPQMRPRLTSTQRSDSQAGPIIETTELEAARFKSLPLCDDSYLEKITKESVGTFKMKPCLELQQHSALDSLLQKVDSSSKQFNGIAAKNEGNEMDIDSTAVESIKDLHNPFKFLSSPLLESGSNNNIALSSLPSYLITPEQAIPKTLSVPTKPQKRLASLDRLSETINSLENLYNAQLKN